MGFRPIFCFWDKWLGLLLKVRSEMSRDALIRLLEPTIEQLGYELADLEWRQGGRNGLLRIYIDRDGGVDVDDCGAVSRQVSAILDVEDPLPGHYTLEVSSPGLDRTLTKPAHFRRFTGQDIRVKLRFPLDGRRNFRGALVSADDEKIKVDVDGQSFSLPLATIESARLVPAL